ncbi:MAG: Crp/Fnr family transcriptional regulator [Deltaproteobacteria bacterium]|nr:Crp/Fnr family transcriptional regulator [Deltaproteobacteria bacterium]
MGEAREHSQERRRELLQKVPLFSGLAPERLEALAGATTTRRLASREPLFHRGDAAAQVYVVASGRLKVVATSKEGGDMVLAILDEGEVVGELPMLTGGRRTASVVALEPCELVALARRDFLRFLREQPEAAVELLVVLAERLVRISEFAEDTLFLAVPARLAKKLLHLAERFGSEAGSGVRIGLRLSQSELADLVGTTRESVNKQLRAWSGDGILRMERGELTILDPARLEHFAGLVAR